ncbi:hypothetical protein BV210_16505 [Halorientalis sp. IM1011]|uniref:hypothetical protein n=1 Tax=Halorientalis sp. IM1011 TaxID=1932360 RepID=UPI00097CC488|nr:hypothetical protein [Halorientalis sp. IM1011]AQL44214.1 hypothetical protein BV210_16505 [Halorientalis sp. IM1011]
MRRNTNAGLDRRQFIAGLAAGTGALASTGVAVAGCEDHDEPDLDEVADGKSEKTYYCLQKRWFFEKKFLKLTPLKGSIPVEELYGWDRTHYSSTGTKPLQRENTCTMFFYEGPDGDVSLVIVHEKWTGDNDGGAASFEFLGLPEDGSWTVRDDDYDASSNYDEWETDGKHQTVHWTWAGGRNDGGAYGPLDDDLYFRIDPSFNEEAELYGEEYEGEVEKWQVLSGRLDDPERHTLWMDEGANFFKSIFSGRDHEDFWEEKRDEWEDGDETDDREEDGGKDHDDEKRDDEKHEDEDRGDDDEGSDDDHDWWDDDDDEKEDDDDDWWD